MRTAKGLSVFIAVVLLVGIALIATAFHYPWGQGHNTYDPGPSDDDDGWFPPPDDPGGPPPGPAPTPPGTE